LGYLQPHNDLNNLICRVTARGWQRISQLRDTPLQSKKAFVALKFAPDMLAMFKDKLAPALLRAGYTAEISGTPEHNDQIDAKIIVQIKSARFVVADVTHENQGVYFEAGYALGLGRPVIWTCRRDLKGKIHFDTRQYNHILWNDGDELAAKLHDRVVATI
jgi:nucleoside 2-deoxyribosyltransferase